MLRFTQHGDINLLLSNHSVRAVAAIAIGIGGALDDIKEVAGLEGGVGGLH